MGVIYKLKPEIIDFILEEKKTKPILSCRGMTALVEEKFQIKLSKSSINSIIKQQGLSLPVGRRQKKRRKPVVMLEKPQEPKLLEVPVEIKPEAPAPVIPVPEPQPKPIKVAEPLVEIKAQEPKKIACTGAILLKAADYLIGGSYYFSDAIKARLNRPNEDFLAKTESLIYLGLFQGAKEAPKSIAYPLAGQEIPAETIVAYLNELQSVKSIPLDLLRIISSTLQEVRCVKVNMSDGSIMYLDGQLHTIWSTPHIPHDFSTTIYDIKSYINRYFRDNSPFLLFMAPGYDAPTKEFFSFILSFDSTAKKITQLTLCDSNFDELERLSINQDKKQYFVFGLWPWQFVEYRKVKKIGEFKPFFAEPLGKEIYAAEIEIELTQPNTSQHVTFRGNALKTNLTEKTRLIVLTNFVDDAPASQWLNAYLSHWPNFEEAFHDYSRKIELFTYTGASGRFFSTEILKLEKETNPESGILFSNYLEALDLYVRWHFLPVGYENKDFAFTKEHFYKLTTDISQEKDGLRITFKPPQGFPLLKDLEYACRRLNEREILTSQKLRLWFAV